MSKIHLVFGPQGAGKSTYAKELAARVNGVYFAIDEWMENLYGKDFPSPLNLPWIMERVARCESQIWAATKQIVSVGNSVVLDLGFMKAKNRAMFFALAETIQVPVQLHYVTASYELRRSRVLVRNQQKGETFSFEVTPPMFDFMEREFEPPTQNELEKIILIDTGAKEQQELR